VGEVFDVLPCVSSVVVVPTPAWLLPGPSNVVHVTVPCTFVQLSGSGAAPDEATVTERRSPNAAQDSRRVPGTMKMGGRAWRFTTATKYDRAKLHPPYGSGS
jgi:hypothetical protein